MGTDMAQAMPPKRLNGYPVRMHGDRVNFPGSKAVLVEKAHEWVVATWGPMTGSEWCWGHYFCKTETDTQRAYRTFREMTVEGTRIAG